MDDKKLALDAIKKEIAALKLVLCDIGQAFKDGKIDVSDLQYVFDIVKKAEVIKDAVLAAPQVLPEVKDLDSIEAAELLGLGLDLIKSVRESFKA
jgi:hypothetical protein